MTQSVILREAKDPTVISVKRKRFFVALRMTA